MSAVAPIRPAEIPPALAAYLAEQQDRARELQDTLERISGTYADDNGALVLAARVARGINEALDRTAIRGVLADRSEEAEA